MQELVQSGQKSEHSISVSSYQASLEQQIDYEVHRYTIDLHNVQLNPNFPHLTNWIAFYMGPATAQYHQKLFPIAALKDENRNAIVPSYSTVVEGRRYYLSVKGCGAIEDMFTGLPLTHANLRTACRDPALLSQIDRIISPIGFIMGESWMGESPYGAQGQENGQDELKFSTFASPLAIQGAYFCPVIALVKCPQFIEDVARKFFWFRTYPHPFYQCLRLVPSRIRLYFESSELLADPEHLMQLIGIHTASDLRRFELNFIRSGIALLSLFSRSATVDTVHSSITGLVYQDVWFDKDTILSLDGLIHFADLEGLIFKQIPYSDYQIVQYAEWQKLIFEFIYALLNLDSLRRKLEGSSLDFSFQRQELCVIIQTALEQDSIASTMMKGNTLYIILHKSPLPSMEIPFFEQISPI